MNQIKIAASDLKNAILNYFTDSIEIKVKRATIIMIPLIVIGSLIAYVVNH
jgi:hypothetical protein